MSFISVFDVMGPNMIGPSSSHTAGAARIALLARKLLTGSLKKVEFTLYGSFAKTYHGHGTDRALLGGIMGFATDDVRIRDSFQIATDNGIEYAFIPNNLETDVHPNTVDILMVNEKGQEMTIRGESLGGGKARLCRINGVEVDFTGEYSSIVVVQKDAPGVVAYITKCLSELGINIAFMRLFRESKGNTAYTIVGNRIGDQIEVEYVYQDLADIPAGFEVPEGRTKPWGTGQAVLCCKDVVKEPFVIINADDYYGKEAFKLLHDYLIAHAETADKMQMGMAGFILKNTVSENGTVTRGVCVVDENGMLEQIHETTGISIQADGVHCDSEAVQKWITPDSNVSMNMWAGYPDFIQVLDERFAEFLKDEAGDPLKKEYLLPNIVGDLLKEGNVDVKVLETHDKWIGITYKEDTELAQAGFKKMTEDGVYPEKLWN